MGTILIILGILFSVLFLFHFLMGDRNKYFFLKLLPHITSLTIPKIVQSISPPQFDMVLAYAIFLSAFVIGLAISTTTFIFFHYKIKVKGIRSAGQMPTVFFPFLYGVKAFDKYVVEIKREIEEKRSDDIEMRSFIEHSSYAKSQLLLRMAAVLQDNETDGFIAMYSREFRSLFFGELEARFTFRQVNESWTELVCRYSTRTDKTPGNIPLKGKTLINLSAELGKPVIFSRHIHSHHSTENGSIADGIYDDYASFCLLKTPDGRAVYSVCLDVKGLEAVKKLHLLVDSGIFTDVCLVMAEKFLTIAATEISEINVHQNLEVNSRR